MQLKWQQETFNAISSVAGQEHVAEALRQLDEFAGAMRYAETTDLKEAEHENLEYCRRKLARLGLQLSQVTMPLLQQLVAQSLEVAGKAAVREVCAPGRRDYGGGHIEEIPSEFTLPPEFEESVIERVAGKLRGR